ncbi:NADPH-dependent FMN reductase, partial [Streptomyces olivaceus]
MTHTASAHTASAHTTTAPLRVTLLVGSNRHGRFGPRVAGRGRGHLAGPPDQGPPVGDGAPPP